MIVKMIRLAMALNGQPEALKRQKKSLRVADTCHTVNLLTKGAICNIDLLTTF